MDILHDEGDSSASGNTLFGYCMCKFKGFEVTFVGDLKLTFIWKVQIEYILIINMYLLCKISRCWFTVYICYIQLEVKNILGCFNLTMWFQRPLSLQPTIHRACLSCDNSQPKHLILRLRGGRGGFCGHVNQLLDHTIARTYVEIF